MEVHRDFETIYEDLNIGKAISKGTKSIDKGVKKTTSDVKEGVNKGVKQTEKGINQIKDATLGGIMDALNGIIKIVNKAGNFFEKFGPYIERIFNNIIDFFEKWGDALKFMGNPTKAIAIILTICVPVVGQLIARFMLYNGSMDHLWLMLFAIPPISLVPAFAMMFGYIKPLKGGSPWDNIVWVPLIGTLIGSLISKDNRVMNILKVGFGVGSFCLAYLYKSKGQCPKQNGSPLSKVALDALVSYIVMIVLTVALPFTPFVGKFFEVVTMLVPYGDLCLQAFAVFLIYVGTNIINGSLTSSLCTLDIPENDLYGLLLTAIGLTFIVSFAPGNMISMMSNISSKL